MHRGKAYIAFKEYMSDLSDEYNIVGELGKLESINYTLICIDDQDNKYYFKYSDILYIEIDEQIQTFGDLATTQVSSTCYETSYSYINNNDLKEGNK